MSSSPQKGQSVPLKITPKGNQRLQVGISWDVGEHTVTKGRWMFKKQVRETFLFDLDLFCCIYDVNGELLDMVTPENASLMDTSEQIFHIGDNQTGRTSGDDEYISLNLGPLPAHIHSVVFCVVCHDGKKFSEVNNPEARVADGTTDEAQLHVDLSKGNDAKRNGYVFAKITRDTEAEFGWTLTYIGEFIDQSVVEDWAQTCRDYLSRP